MKPLLLTGISLTLLWSCNGTPEIVLNEALPSAVPPSSTPSASVSPSVSPSTSASATPLVTPTTVAPDVTNTPTPAPVITPNQSGSFMNAAHKVSGMAKIIQNGDDFILRLEDFETENGPDLYVYLVKNATGTPGSEQDFLNLGRLKSTKGNQNYELPQGFKENDFLSVSIWCKAFSVNFGFAPFK